MNLETSVAYSFVPEKAVSRPFKAQAVDPSPRGPLAFPCRSGKLREKTFSLLVATRKIISYQDLERDSLVESKARQGSGREARKPPDWRLASADHY
jgi:hypothetical protein